MQFSIRVKNKPIEHIVEAFKRTDSPSDEILKKELPFFRDGLIASSTKETMANFLQSKLTSNYRRRMSFASQAKFNRGQVKDYMNFISNDWNSTSYSQQIKKNNTQDADDTLIELILIDTDSDEKRSMKIGLSTTLKSLFNKYADERGISARLLRFTFAGNILFLSSIGHKTALQMGMKHNDVINVVYNSSNSSDEVSKCSKERNQKRLPLEGKNKLRRVSGRSSWSFPTVNGNHDKFKFDHSQSLSRVFAEAEPKFKKIRQDLNMLNIECTQRKITTRQKKSTIEAKPIDNPVIDELGGKAGKAYYVVHVGEVDNLYKSSKHSGRCIHTSRGSQPISIDLHCMTREQALTKLDKSLSEWIDIAMRGVYPWVIRVVIVCGGGNQILSEVVENWIQQNDNVTLAPRNLFLRKNTL